MSEDGYAIRSTALTRPLPKLRLRPRQKAGRRTPSKGVLRYSTRQTQRGSMPGSDERFCSRGGSCFRANLSCQDERGVYLSDAVDVDGVAEVGGRMFRRTKGSLGGRYKSHSVGNHIIRNCGWTLYETCIWAFWSFLGEHAYAMDPGRQSRLTQERLSLSTDVIFSTFVVFVAVISVTAYQLSETHERLLISPST